MQTYLWIDLETTGLNPAPCQITEIAAILTKGPQDGFEEIDNYEAIVEIPYDGLWERGALDMALKSGLADDLDAKPGLPLGNVEDDLYRLVARFDRPILAARNVAFERGFIDAHLPGLADRLHYRAFDVTPLCLIDPSLYDFDHGIEGTTHRAMYDIRRDLEYGRVFVRRYGEVSP